MKISLVMGLASAALAFSALAQDPSASPAPVITPTVPALAPAIAPTAVPSASASPTATDNLENRIKKKTKGVHISVGDDQHKHDVSVDRDLEDLGPLAAIPIVGIIFGTLSLFGTPVLVVSAIMFFSYLKQRSLHRTVRMMVEKGQAVPPALFSQPPVVRARSDMRRGVVLVMVGLGLMVFFGAVNDWEGGAWALGMIPFLMGAGYLTVWKLEGHKPGALQTSTDIPPRVP
ncbi:MAG: DUF6249 domain-containing protein [Verrucomicrobiota bacterium]|nr:DUF6249 domain-containing protein [Verrucomicrobiota bacterium]